MQPPKDVLAWRGAVRATVARIDLGDLSQNLLLALIWQESAGNPWAWNPERRYPWLWDVRKDKPFRKTTEAELASRTPPADFGCLMGDPDNEWWGQSASWGLTQVMGAAARERGFKGKYLTELCDPYVNLEYGARHLWFYCYQYGRSSTVDALKRWNVNPGYAEAVLAKLTSVENATI